MNALVAGLSDRNSAVRKACAKSIGHLVKVHKSLSIWLKILCTMTGLIDQ